MSIERYENVIIGSGEGGKYLAWHLGKSGLDQRSFPWGLAMLAAIRRASRKT
jgi:hypothetical protein